MTPSPRTGLALLCGTALVCGIAGWSLFNQFQTTEDVAPPDPVAARPADDAAELPKSGAEAFVLLAPLEHYAEIVERPVFATSRRPADQPAAEEADTAQPLTITVTGIIITPDSRVALFDGGGDGMKIRRIREGETVLGWKVVAIEAQGVRFERDGVERNLKPKVQAPPQAPQQARPEPAARRAQERPQESAANAVTSQPARLQSAENPGR